MKKILTFLFAAFLIAPFCVYANDGDPIKIPIGPGPGGNGGSDDGKVNPRSLAVVEGWCANDSVQLNFACDMGVVAVTLVNTTTGSMWCCTAESREGFVVVPFSGESGDYTITIETQTAGIFVGEFYL